ncbi:hypothetical protein AC623_15660 [Bacillus sp. FJAT-27231]|uniref:Ger(x)C family spore germination protein n=1 Tax=Bacillus sp. FJAT-27231 TaxID=1679168 RepID=UPI0006714B4F|nr:Ger(x)C family spore germination protein [Bacillus sp. FJAT-27231]KMY55182.1 hypothetical protein AC623_15660 [Bacillus sp. FJAT-27231]
MKKALFWTVIAVILLFNYNLETKVLEDIQIITATGYDYVDKDTLRGTTDAPFYPQGQDVKPINASFTASGHTIHDIRQQSQREAQRNLGAGRLQSFLISKEVAKHGVKHLIDPLGRSTYIGRDIKLAVVDGSTEKLLTADYSNSQVTSRYLSDLLEESISRLAPETELHTFLAQLDGFGQEPFLPIIKQRDDHIRYMGLALFKDDKYVDELSVQDSYIFKMLHEKFKHGIYEIKYKGAYIAIENLQSKVKYSVSGTAAKPRLTIHVTLRGKVQEGYGLTLHTKAKVHAVEKEWRKEMTTKAEKLIRKLQTLRTDSLGIGERVRSHFRNFPKSSWENLYPNVPIHVEVETNIVNTGIIE